MKLYTIAQLAKKYQITTRTIRYYEELGILTPQRFESKIRYYSNKDEIRLNLILRGKKFGFSLEEIKEMIILFDIDRTGQKQLEKTIEYGERKIEEVAGRIAELTSMKEEMEELLVTFKEKLAKLEGEEDVRSTANGRAKKAKRRNH